MLVKLGTAQRVERFGLPAMPEFSLGPGDMIELSRFDAPSFFYGDPELETQGIGPHALVKINGLEVFRHPYPADCILVEHLPRMIKRLGDTVINVTVSQA